MQEKEKRGATFLWMYKKKKRNEIKQTSCKQPVFFFTATLLPPHITVTVTPLSAHQNNPTLSLFT